MPASVLVVTRNATLGVALVHHGYDVSEVRPDRHGDWTNVARITDAVVLELSDAVAAESAVLRLRAEGIGIPVLLVSNATPGWDTTAAHVGPGALVMPLPISVPKLTSALDGLIEAGPVAVAPPPQNEEELLNAVAASVGLAITDDGTVVPDTEPPTGPRVRMPDLTEPPPAPVEVPESEPAAPSYPPSERLARTVTPPPMPEPRANEAHVAVMLDWAQGLTGVAECADVVVDELADRLGAEAVALLLPDGAEWRVAGGKGLRPLEHRVRLAEDHWLVQHVVVAGDGLVADDTDGARDELIGAPLASWPRVVAAPVPAVRGLVLAARSGEPFGPGALAAAMAVGEEAAPLLTDALAVRRLARALAPFLDLGDD